MVVATQNPIEMEGTYPLPEAQRDRFMARISMGYPDKDAEMEMLETHQATSPLTKVTAVVTAGEVAVHDRHGAAGVRLPVDQGVHRVPGPRDEGKRDAPARCEPPVHAPAAARGQSHGGPGGPGLCAAGRRRQRRRSRPGPPDHPGPQSREHGRDRPERHPRRPGEDPGQPGNGDGAGIIRRTCRRRQGCSRPGCHIAGPPLGVARPWR